MSISVEYLDYICYAVCVFGCLIHLVISIVHSVLQNKKIDNLCKICGLPESSHSGFDHEFTPSEIECFKGELASLENLLYIFSQDESSNSSSLYKTCFDRVSSLRHLLEVLDK